MTKIINLTKNKSTIVDDSDYSELNKYKWYVDYRGYAVRNTYVRESGKRRSIRHSMASAIMNPPKGMVVDHINHNKLDNRRDNLRIATIHQNNQNRVFLGATWHKSSGKWQSQINIGGKCKYIGLFVNKEDAICAYKKLAHENYKEFAPQI